MSKPLARIGQRFTAQFVDGLVALAVGLVFYGVVKAFMLPLELAIGGVASLSAAMRRLAWRSKPGKALQLVGQEATALP